MISRRRFLTTGSAAFLATPLIAEAQQAARVARIGWLWADVTGPLPNWAADAFREKLRDEGWFEGRNLVIEFRHGGAESSQAERLKALARLAAELADLKVDVIFASPAPAAIAAKRVVTAIPVVFAGVSDPVGFGLVASLAKPGGNFTGVSFQSADLNPKRLDLLREVVPGVRKIAALVDRDHQLRERMLNDLQTVARTANIELHVALTVSTDPGSLDEVFDAVGRERVGAVLGLPVAYYYQHRRKIAELALKHRLPTMFELGDFAEAGCLMGYGASGRDTWRLAATYVTKILRGAKPADLPVEQPTKFELVINLKTAKALGLTIPPSLLLRADQVIE
jgi:putative ABC transport system substrate-binding protein